MMGHLCEAFLGFGLLSEFVLSGVKLVVFNYDYQYCYEKLCQQCVAIIVQLLLNTHILITLLLNKFSASHVCHGWLWNGNWCHSGFISICMSIKGVAYLSTTLSSPPHHPVQCARMFIYITTCTFGDDMLEYPNHKIYKINISFLKN